MPKKTREEVLREQQTELQGILEQTRAAFEGTFGEELKRLQGLSDEDLATIVPNVSDHVVYAQLMDGVKHASAANLSIAQLKQRIQALGSSAIAIAKKVHLV